MNTTATSIPLQGLVIAFVPAMITIAILFRWAAGAKTAVYATARMLLQLLLIGYVLVYIFESDNAGVIVAVLIFMLVVSSWIAIRPLQVRRRSTYLSALAAITIGGVLTLALVSHGVLSVQPWFSPRHLIPLAGMIFAGSMTTISLAAERLSAELEKGALLPDARRIALQASLIPVTNSLLAVGLVSLPGMMTGQILSGVSPMVAAKYQIVVMTMLFGASGISAAIYLTLESRQVVDLPSDPADSPG